MLVKKKIITFEFNFAYAFVKLPFWFKIPVIFVQRQAFFDK